MGWPKGQPRTEAQKQAISSGLLLGPKPHNICQLCGKECPKPGKKVKWCSPECRNSDPKYLEEHHKRVKDPEWRKKVSEATKKRMHDSDVRDKHLNALDDVFLKAKNGHNFPSGPSDIVLEFAKVLCPAGYLMDEIRISRRNKTGYLSTYTLDFGHPEAKVDIEIDGSSHKYSEEHDDTRDNFLRSEGWKVIRIKV
jgi:hypothetical protein